MKTWDTRTYKLMQHSLSGSIFNNIFTENSFRHTTGVNHTENCFSKGKWKGRETGILKLMKNVRDKNKECECTFLSKNRTMKEAGKASLKHNWNINDDHNYKEVHILAIQYCFRWERNMLPIKHYWAPPNNHITLDW